MASQPHPKFTFTVEALPDEVPPIHRLRMLLKRALRDWRLKCVDMRELPPEKAGEPPEEAK